MKASRDILQNLYSNKWENLKQLNGFVETCALKKCKTTQYQLHWFYNKKWDWNSLKSLDPHGFSFEFIKTFKGELKVLILKYFHKMIKKGSHRTIYKVIIAMVTKPDKDTTCYFGFYGSIDRLEVRCDKSITILFAQDSFGFGIFYASKWISSCFSMKEGIRTLIWLHWICTLLFNNMIIFTIILILL